MVPCSGISAFIVGTLLWGRLVARHPAPRPARGAACGAFVGILSHPIAWYLMLVAYWLRGARSSLGEPTVDPITALAGAAVFSAWSIFLAGWLTVPVAALVGWILALRARAQDASIGVVDD